MKYYKFTKKDRLGIYQTGYQYPTPGQWTEPVKPVLCEAGYHVCSPDHLFNVCSPDHLFNWKYESLWEVDVKGEAVHGDDKSFFEQIRLVRQIESWNTKTLRLYAADVAEDVLEFFESQYPDDDRPRRAILAARDYADGLISGEQLQKAARAAAYASAAAADAYFAATDAAVAYASAAVAAKSAAYAAAYDAAYVGAAAAAAAHAAAAAAYASAAAADDYDAAAVYDNERKQALDKYKSWLLERLGIEK
jgi:hypothetical protein